MKNKEKKSLENSMKIKLVLICLISILALSAATYAFFYLGKSQSGLSKLETSCFGTEFTDGESISLTNALPMKDEEGLKTTPYTFTIKNICDLESKYYVIINVKEGSFSPSTVSASIDGGTPQLLTAYKGNSEFSKEEGYSSSYILTTGSLKKNESSTHNLKMWLSASTTYNEVKGKSFEAQVKVVSVVKELDDIIHPNATETLLKKANLASVTKYTNENTGEMYTFTHPATEQTEALTDYRYIGANPNNWIRFNDEDWRIIGVFTVETESGEKKQLIKIIRNDSLGTIPWDDYTDGSATNEWSSASLQKLLNGDYYNTDGSFSYTYYDYDPSTETITIPKGLNSTARSQIENVKWYLGGSSTDSGLGGPDYYAFERGTTVYSGRSTNIIQRVGLMYPSDYVYTYANGVDDKCYTDGYNCSTSQGGTPSTSWLFNSSYWQWIQAPYASGSEAAFGVYAAGYVSSVSVELPVDVRPAVYLSSDIKITDGDGSSSTSAYTIE